MKRHIDAQRRSIIAGIGHNLPQVAPLAFADAVSDLLTPAKIA